MRGFAAIVVRPLTRPPEFSLRPAVRPDPGGGHPLPQGRGK
jgi:hypothetical protein